MSLDNPEVLPTKEYVYPSPPIKEALCEWRMVNPVKFDDALISMLDAQFLGEFSNRTERRTRIISLGAPDPNEVNDQISGLVYTSNDNRILVQFQPNAITVNNINGYFGWDEFRHLIQKIHKQCVEVFNDAVISHFHMRYINELPVPGDQFLISDLFNIYVTAPDDEKYSAFSKFSIETITSVNASEVIAFRSSDRRIAEDKTAFIIDIENIRLVNLPLSSESFQTLWVEAHDKIKEFWRLAITDKVHRELLGETNG